MKPEHSDKCASHKYFWSGDQRNPHMNPDWERKEECDCDGYHTFKELYDHRIELYIALCRVARHDNGNDEFPGFPYTVWRSKSHSDGTSFKGWFILGVEFNGVNGKQITYHLPNSRWNDTDFAYTLEKAPEWDGHTSDDVLNRLKSL